MLSINFLDSLTGKMISHAFLLAFYFFLDSSNSSVILVAYHLLHPQVLHKCCSLRFRAEQWVGKIKMDRLSLARVEIEGEVIPPM